jgi:hypothetical protein
MGEEVTVRGMEEGPTVLVRRVPGEPLVLLGDEGLQVLAEAQVDPSLGLI